MVALVELYDLQSFSSSTFANISTRGRVNTGKKVLIAGYIVGGYQAQRVVVRAIGPSLTQFGVSGALADPFLELHNAQGTTIMSNNEWQDPQKQERRHHHSAFKFQGISSRHQSDESGKQTLIYYKNRGA